MRIALVLTVKNEERLLRNNLLYHRAIGIEKAFVYFDNTTDSGEESIKDLNFVESCASVPADLYKKCYFLKKFTTQAVDHHTARQCLNSYDAGLKAENEGFDWLISLDADELVTTSLDEVLDLKYFFQRIAPQIDAVIFEVKEVLQAKNKYQNVFVEESRFKTRRSFRRYSHNIFKKFYNPSTGKLERHVYWYGHNSGKMAIRLNRNIIPHNPHRFIKSNGEKLVVVEKGLLLHYHAYDARDFIKKYQNFGSHPRTYLSGRNVENLKLLFIEIVNRSNLNEVQQREYFKKYLMFNEKEIRNLRRNRVFGLFKRKEPVLIEIHSVANIFKKLHFDQSS